MKSGNKEGAASVFNAARKFRRRRRRLFVAALISVLSLGYAFSQVSLFASLTVEAGETAVVKDPLSPPGVKKEQKAGEREAGSPPAPEKSCDDWRVLVDREHPLPYYYEPEDLVSLSAYGIPLSHGETFLRQQAARQLSRLMAAAAADGEELLVASAYRSFADQQSAYAKWEGYYGTGAGGMSAPPGQSQHQLGTAVDFTNAEIGYEVHQNFGGTGEAAWLRENAPDYGFVLAYPKGAGSELGYNPETGYNWEPWHYRYIGKENVERLKAGDLSLQAFLVRENVLPRC